MDDMLVVSHEYSTIMQGVAEFYDLKKYPETNNNCYEPRRYLGSNVSQFDLPNVSGTAWFMSGGYYVKEAVNSVSTNINEAGSKLNVKKY